MKTDPASKLLVIALVVSPGVAGSGDKVPPGHGHHPEPPTPTSNGSFSVLWESQYVLEGRSVLDGGGLVSIAADWNVPVSEDGGIAFRGWYAEGTDVEYSEFKLAAACGWSLGTIDFGIGFTWLEFIEEGTEDREVSFELIKTMRNGWMIEAAVVYSAQEGGSFVELGISRVFEQTGFTWSPHVLIGVNEGYVADVHEGLNNLQLGLDITIPINGGFELYGFMAYTYAMNERPGESLDDIFWGGVGVQWGR